MLVRCNACKGGKKIIGLGGFDTDCRKCKGAGVVSIEEAIEPVTDKKKRGRPFKQNGSEVDGEC